MQTIRRDETTTALAPARGLTMAVGLGVLFWSAILGGGWLLFTG
jgi:hypothetical protein